jgi:hypothetical protein
LLWQFIYCVFISLNIIINVGGVVHSFVLSFHIQFFFMFFKLLAFAPPSSFCVVFVLNIGFGIYIVVPLHLKNLLQHLFCCIILICVMLTSTRLLQCCNVLDFMCASFWMLLKVLAMLASITLIHCFVFWFYMTFLLLHYCNLCFMAFTSLLDYCDVLDLMCASLWTLLKMIAMLSSMPLFHEFFYFLFCIMQHLLCCIILMCFM